MGDRILRKVNLRWKTETKVLPWYTAKPEYSESVFAFIAQASVDPNWLGSGLEFDRV